MGRRPGDAPVLVCRIGAEDAAWAAVKYEILRYKTMHGLKAHPCGSLRCLGRSCARIILGRTQCRS